MVNEGAEKWLGEPIQVLDKGLLRLVDYLGNDCTVVAAARTSFARDVDPNDVVGNSRLIDFLYRNHHGTPFEQCSLSFEVKAPLFVFREWHRHRMSKINEMSGRYTQLPNEVYTPERSRIRKQSKSNKQGSGEEVHEDVKDVFLQCHEDNTDLVFRDYDLMVNGYGIAKELARIDLPLSTYSKMIWQMDLRNLLHFLELRMAPNAQHEIRLYANAIAEVVKEAFPMTWAAFEEHTLYALTLSKTEVELLREMLGNCLDNVEIFHWRGLDTVEERNEKKRKLLSKLGVELPEPH